MPRFKEDAGAGKVTLIGIRHTESARRKKRNEIETTRKKFSGDYEQFEEYRQAIKAERLRKASKKKGVNITNADDEKTVGCIRGKESLLISPIIYWTDTDVWEFLDNVVRVPHCILYDDGWHRIGCINCPMASPLQKRMENERFPHVKRNWLRTIRKIRAGGGINKGYVWRSIPETDFQRLLNITSPFDALTEEEENRICEAIYDYWTSQKPYKKWMADRFEKSQQQKLF